MRNFFSCICSGGKGSASAGRRKQKNKMDGNSNGVEEGSFFRSDTGVDFSTLPEACIVYILALTSPLDVCRMRAVAPWLLPVVESDALWLRFLPEDYLQILARSSESTSLRDFSSKKELFFHLCDSPLLIDEGKKLFWLEKWSGKKCYMLRARELTITGDNTPQPYLFWRRPAQESRFSETACVDNEIWLEIKGMINVSMLSLGTNYAVYLVFDMTVNFRGLEGTMVKSSIKIEGVETTIRVNYLTIGRMERMDMYMSLLESDSMSTYTRLTGRHIGDCWRELCRWNLLRSELRRRELNSSQEPFLYPTQRKDGWCEAELGEFFTKGGEDIEVEITHLDRNMSGLLIGGIEIRPKDKL